MTLTHHDVAHIIKLMDASTLDELVIEIGGIRIEARRRGETVEAVTTHSGVESTPSARASAALPPPEAIATPGTVASAGSQATALAPGQVAVTAPMVGTFYRRPSPDAPPFVEVGARVGAGDELCLVEVMKLFTTLVAEQAGTLTQICAEDASLVEYGQVLFIIDAD